LARFGFYVIERSGKPTGAFTGVFGRLYFLGVLFGLLVGGLLAGGPFTEGKTMTKLVDKSTNQLSVRWLIRKDLGEVLKIENAAYGDPWSENDFIEQLRERSTIGMVVESEFGVVGYMVYQLQAEHIELLNFAISPGYRRRRAGSVLIQKLISKLTEKRQYIKLYISERNLPGQLFFKSRGFRAVRVIRNFHENGVGAYEMVFKSYSFPK
jgi:ribosomal-protein-alanine N-acetyltransferase